MLDLKNRQLNLFSDGKTIKIYKLNTDIKQFMGALNNLKTGISFACFKGDVRQPHNYAMERIPSGYLRWHTATMYVSDIERIMQELKLSLSLVSNIPDDEFLASHSINSEDYIMYHQGYFLDLVHQLKDKICQLTKALITYDYSSNHEKQADLAKIVKNTTAQRIPNLLKFLKEWNADDPEQKGFISIALKKRTLYHHFKNPLSGIQSYFQAKTNRFLLSPSFKPHLSEYGKQMIAQRSIQNLQSWQSETIKKMSGTLKAIEENIENISNSLITYYRLPHTAALGKKIIARYVNLDKSLEVPDSNYRIETIKQPFRKILEMLSNVLLLALGEEFVALYVTGSIPRGDFNFGLSDVNFVIILKSNNPQLKALVKKITDAPANEFKIPIDTKIISQAEFMSPQHAKERFICRTDGLLLSGINLLNKEKDQKICFKLAWMLNKDYKDYLTSLKSVLEDASNPLSNRDLTLMARELGKRTYRLCFSQVIGNNLKYTSYPQKMRQLNNFYYPQNRQFNDKTFQYSTAYPIATRNDLMGARNSIEEKIIPLYEAINKAVNG